MASSSCPYRSVWTRAVTDLNFKRSLIGTRNCSRTPSVVTETRLPSLDVLRGAAAVGVFLFHAAIMVGFDKRTLPAFEAFGRTWSKIPSLFSFGATGVTLFFVLSGFCLSLKPLTSGSLRLATYYRDRFARIYPAYFVAIMLSLAGMTFRGAEWSLREAAAVFTFLQGGIQQWHFALNGALWSMSTEVQFYILFPAVFALCCRMGTTAAVAALFGALAFRVGVTQLNSADYLVGGINRGTFLMNTLAGRIPDFTFGVVLAHLWLRDPRVIDQWSRLLIIPAGVLGVLARLYGPTWFADPALAVMCATVTAFVVTHVDFRPNSCFAMFGRMSYSFFLLHVPVLAMVIFCTDLTQQGPYQRIVTVSVMSFVVTLLIGAALYRFVEIPAMNAIKRIFRFNRKVRIA
jgi:peptidoglycan/LPS O-acetylase OafA/YrhL